MIKKFILGVLIVTPIVAIAQPINQQPKQAKGTDIKEPKYEISKDKFNELKSVAIASIDRRVELLKKEKICIQNAQERPDLKKCLLEQFLCCYVICFNCSLPYFYGIAIKLTTKEI